MSEKCTSGPNLVKIASGGDNMACSLCACLSRCWQDCGGVYLLAIVGVRSIEELDAREGASELATTGDPGDGGSLVKQEAGVEELDTLLLDESHTQHLALLLIRNQLSRQHLPCHTKLATSHVCHTCNALLQSDICSNNSMLCNYGGCADKTNKETDDQSFCSCVNHEIRYCMCDIPLVTAAADGLDNSKVKCTSQFTIVLSHQWRNMR